MNILTYLNQPEAIIVVAASLFLGIFLYYLAERLWRNKHQLPELKALVQESHAHLEAAAKNNIKLYNVLKEIEVGLR